MNIQMLALGKRIFREPISEDRARHAQPIHAGEQDRSEDCARWRASTPTPEVVGHGSGIGGSRRCRGIDSEMVELRRSNEVAAVGYLLTRPAIAGTRTAAQALNGAIDTRDAPAPPTRPFVPASWTLEPSL